MLIVSKAKLSAHRRYMFFHLRKWSRHKSQHAVANVVKLNYSNFKPAMTHKDRTRNFENNLRISCMHFHNNTSPEALIIFALQHDRDNLQPET